MENSYYKITKEVEEMKDYNPIGNIIPHIWYSMILLEDKKPDINAITILSEIVYWYRPTQDKDEIGGAIQPLRKKFKADMLQKGYRDLCSNFGLSKQQVLRALKRLEEMNLIKRHIVHLPIPNTLFIQLFPKNLMKMELEAMKKLEGLADKTKSYMAPNLDKGITGDTLKEKPCNATYETRVSPMITQGITGDMTYTENTTENTNIYNIANLEKNLQIKKSQEKAKDKNQKNLNLFINEEKIKSEDKLKENSDIILKQHTEDYKSPPVAPAPPLKISTTPLHFPTHNYKVTFLGDTRLPIMQKAYNAQNMTNNTPTISSNTNGLPTTQTPLKHDINYLIGRFSTINPVKYKKFYKNKTERASLDNLVSVVGYDSIDFVISYVLPWLKSMSETDKYAPVVLSPYELESKIEKVRNYYERQMGENKKTTLTSKSKTGIMGV